MNTYQLLNTRFNNIFHENGVQWSFRGFSSKIHCSCLSGLARIFTSEILFVHYCLFLGKTSEYERGLMFFRVSEKKAHCKTIKCRIIKIQINKGIHTYLGLATALRSIKRVIRIVKGNMRLWQGAQTSVFKQNVTIQHHQMKKNILTEKQ